jgi:hypothetical protein
VPVSCRPFEAGDKLEPGVGSSATNVHAASGSVVRRRRVAWRIEWSKAGEGVHLGMSSRYDDEERRSHGVIGVAQVRGAPLRGRPPPPASALPSALPHITARNPALSRESRGSLGHLSSLRLPAPLPTIWIRRPPRITSTPSPWARGRGRWAGHLIVRGGRCPTCSGCGQPRFQPQMSCMGW